MYVQLCWSLLHNALILYPLVGKSKLPIDWPSPLHNKCSNGDCIYPNLPQPVQGTFICVGCGQGNYVVTKKMAAEADEHCRRAIEFHDRNRRKFHTIQTTNERRRAERDFARYENETKPDERREKWPDRPSSSLERRLGTKGPLPPAAQPPKKNTLAIRHAPEVVSPQPRTRTLSRSKPKPPKSTYLHPYVESYSTPNPGKSSLQGVLQKWTGRTPERVYNPNTYNPNWAEDAGDPLLRKPRPFFETPPVRPPRRHDPFLCSRNCPIHSKPKPKKEEGSTSSVAPVPTDRSQKPVRPLRPPTTASLSIYSQASWESEVPVAVVDDAEYYASKAQLELRSYMPRRVDANGPV
ncbi:hypothetical protein BDP27DRAFT_1522675 [Rhodocollybia butyracea]|uniref:Uncharacterized protein n=1 Tax=Rhodocollybia butyracea TaxID=206335 RepID=A0A9P5PTE0_9AGAR|nr:hypothetical protein BDP27DRAFT_1522675 [Rhodocollybia butyracea]